MKLRWTDFLEGVLGSLIVGGLLYLVSSWWEAALAGGLLVLVGWLLKLNFRRAIARRVAAPAENGPASRSDPPPIPIPRRTAEPSLAATAVDRKRLVIDVIEADRIPPPSEATGAMLEGIMEYGARLRWIYRVALLSMIGLDLVLVHRGLLAGPSSFEDLPLMMLIVNGIVLAVDWSGVKAVRLHRGPDGPGGPSGPWGHGLYFHRGFGQTASRASFAGVVTPPILLPVVCWLWVAILAEELGVQAGIVVWLAYLLWTLLGRWYLGSRYKLPEPPTLLALRVFNSPSLGVFLHLVDLWRWLGVLQRLDGPMTRGYSIKDQLYVLAGRADEVIVDDEARLDEQLDSFTLEPDSRRTYPEQHLLCGSRIWELAVTRMIRSADVVVMYLGEFREENAGCQTELQLLINAFPLRRVVLLINDSTDLPLLKEILANAYANRLDKSPNEQDATIRVVQIDKLHSAQLVSFLYDIARG